MGIKSKCFVNSHWIGFNLLIGSYDNIITFLDAQKLLFLSELYLDFSTIPFELHGKGHSSNLLQYLANNTDDNLLVSRFLEYFLNVTLDMRYLSGKKIDFILPEESNWQNFTVSILNPYTTTTTTTATPIIYGQSVMFIYQDNGIYKYKVNNFTENMLTDELSFDLDSNIWYIDQYLSVTDKGFIEIFYDDNNTYKILIINVDGSIYYQKDITNYYNYEFINKYVTIQYEENGKYYFLVYDGSVRTFEFDNYIYLNTSFDDYLGGGIIVYEENVNNYYLIKDDSNDLIFLREQAVGENLSCNIYEYSNLITFFVYDSITNYLLSIEIYDISSTPYLKDQYLTLQKLLDYSFSGASSSLNGIYYFSYLNKSNDYVLSSYDSSLLYIFYYSSISNTISYKTIFRNYDINMFYNVNTYSDNSDYDADSILILLTTNYINVGNNIYYYDSVFMLPLFKNDAEIRDLYEFTSGGTSGWTYQVRLSADHIHAIIDSGNVNYDILVFSKSGVTTVPTSISKDSNIYNNYYLYDRNIILINSGDTFTTHFITLDGIQISGFTFNNNYNYNIYNNRNTFVFSQSGETTYYTNTQTGNKFYYINSYYDSYQTSYYKSSDNLRDGKIFMINYETELGQMITDNFASEPISIRLIENSLLSKYYISIGTDYFSIQQIINQDQNNSGGTLIKISYFNINCDLINSITSDSYNLYSYYYFGNRYFGFYNNQYYIFDGSNISIVNTTDTNDLNINDWWWWND